MLVSILFSLLSLLIPPIHSLQIPYIDNAIFIPISASNTSIVNNQTCNQCICQSNFSQVALNCFPNDTCQFFNAFPLRYAMQPLSQGRFYFLQQTFPNASQCCMPNTTDLLTKLNTATPIHVNVSGPRCLVLDNHGYLVTVSETNKTIVRFYPTNLSLVTQPASPTFNAKPFTIAYYNEAYYVGFTGFILVIDSNNLSVLYNITPSFLSQTRDMIFLNDGQIMVVASTDKRTLLFLEKVDNTSKNYNFSYNQSVNYPNPHGLWYVNDTFFYSTSWDKSEIYSYSFVSTNPPWTQTLALNSTLIVPPAAGAHLAIDECDRFWFSLVQYGLRIFDKQGELLGNLTHTVLIGSFDTIIADNYVIYVSNQNTNQIIRIDPHIQC